MKINKFNKLDIKILSDKISEFKNRFAVFLKKRFLEKAIIKKSFRKKIFILLSCLVLLMIYIAILPSRLFKEPVCTVVEDKDGNLLGARIAADGQWRFPPTEVIPEKFAKAIVAFEDKRFRYHWGFDVIALSRALKQNIVAGQVVSGGSTIPMQVIRLARKGKSRTVVEKIIEIILATRLEFSFSKESILALYTANAPFGSNIVGLEAASWRYFGISPAQLSWAESAMLAVLPNSPALIHPGKNRLVLLKKRNRLLEKLLEKKIIDTETYQLAIEEPLPNKPYSFPQLATQLVDRINASKKDGTNSRTRTTLDIRLQQKCEDKIKKFVFQHERIGIRNAAIIVLEVGTGNVIVYAGNANPFDKDLVNKEAFHVDIITSERSTGSILKPFLYAAMLTSGEILPQSLVPDIPINIGGFMPKNYNLGFDGAVPANRAIARSLNIPAVKMLDSYGIDRFYNLLGKIGMNTLHRPANHYGLSLILGGCEGSLWELSGIYASMARSLNHFDEYQGQYDKNDFHPPQFEFVEKQKEIKPPSEGSSWFSASAIWLTFKAMLDVERPEEENQWRYFTSSRKIAWKTGTSFGFRDAWAIGVTPDFVTGVWIGNADGEGHPDLIGVMTAAPVLFEVFDFLPEKKAWFEQPFDDMTKVRVCRQSGYLASTICENVDTIFVPLTGSRFSLCPYHQLIHLDKSGCFRVHSDCESPSNMIHKPWFVLPPAIEWFYKYKNLNYKSLPPIRFDCILNAQTGINSMQVIYPKNYSKIYVPLELSGRRGSAIFEIAHRKPETLIYWHIDEQFIGQTKNFHKMELHPAKGKHILSLVDEYGENLSLNFEIIDKE